MDPADIKHECTDPFVPKASNELDWNELSNNIYKISFQLKELQSALKDDAIYDIKPFEDFELRIKLLYSHIYNGVIGGVELVEKAAILKHLAHKMLQFVKKADLLLQSDRKNVLEQLEKIGKAIAKLEDISAFERKTL